MQHREHATPEKYREFVEMRMLFLEDKKRLFHLCTCDFSRNVFIQMVSWNCKFLFLEKKDENCNVL